MTFLFYSSNPQSSAASIKRVGAMLLLAVATVGCSSQTGYAIGAQRIGSRPDSTDIVVLDCANRGDFDVIGRVHAHSWAPLWLPWLLKSQDELIGKLVVEASLLNADAVVDIKRYSRSQFEWREEHLMGTAVTIRKRDAICGP